MIVYEAVVVLRPAPPEDDKLVWGPETFLAKSKEAAKNYAIGKSVALTDEENWANLEVLVRPFC